MNINQRKKFIDWLSCAYLDLDNESEIYRESARKEINNKILDIQNEKTKILAIEDDTDLKNYIQDLLIAHVLKAKK